MKTITAILFLISIGFASAAIAGDVEDGWAAYEEGNYEAAFSAFSKAAELGDAEAQYKLADMCREGEGVPQDYKQAMSWFLKAAEQGIAIAQVRIGGMYFGGKGVPQDYKQAMSWFLKAAEQGNAEGQGMIGTMYYFGVAVPQDYKQGMSWHRKAADQGYPPSQVMLGDIYSKGEGIPQDYVQAHKWFNLAAASGYKDAAENRNIAASLMTPAQIDEAQKLASEWKPNTPARAQNYAKADVMDELHTLAIERDSNPPMPAEGDVTVHRYSRVTPEKSQMVEGYTFIESYRPVGPELIATHQYLRAKVAATYCGNPEMAVFRDHDIDMVSEYYYHDGSEAMGFIVTNQDCN